MSRAPASSGQRPKSVILSGGLDLVSAPMAIKAGCLTDALNYESVANGYRRMDGYERFDGHTKPSQASYWVISYTPGGYTFLVDDVITGATSGATGRVMAGVTPPAGQLVLTDVSGNFLPAENMKVLGVVRAVTASAAILRGASNDTDDANWYAQAVTVARSRINVVPGSGPVRGTWIYNGATYAFRDNAFASAGVMWKATAAGWVVVPLGRMVFFTAGGGAGTAPIAEGAVILGSTSGATATVMRVVQQTGSYSAGTATGYLMLSSQTGTFVAETIKVTGVIRATLGGNSGPVTIQPGGRYRFQNYNFYGASNFRRMYGVSGADYAFEFDGTTYTPIVTGMPVDKPTILACHKKYLWLGFAGGSLQFSGLGTPLQFQAILGAAEIGLGDEITGLSPEYVGSLVIFTRKSTSYISGTSGANFALISVAAEAGAIEWTAQTIGVPHYLDEAGLRALNATNDFGNFNIGTLSAPILPLLKGKAEANVRPIASMKVKNKAQYRLFYDDGTGFTVYLAKPKPEFVPFDLGGLVPTCTCVADEVSGDETLLMGTASGMVYQLDAGTSHDGNALDSFVTIAADDMGAPTMNKTFKRAEFQIETDALTDIGVVPSFTEPYDDNPAAPSIALTLFGQQAGYWNEMVWNEFYWSTQSAGLAFTDIEGFGRDVAITVLCNSATQRPHVLKALTYHYSIRGLVH